MKKLNLWLIKYELFNCLSNIFSIIFGVVFPIFMAILFSYVIGKDVPLEDRPYLNATLFSTFIMIIPLATMFIGHAGGVSTEIETGVQLRFKLFGYSERTILAAKVIANIVFLTIALLIFCVTMFCVLDIYPPKPWAFVTLIVFIYVFAISLLILAHAVAQLIGQFGPTFGACMTLYFTFMVFGGMMGVTADQLPSVLKAIGECLPMYYINSQFPDFWRTGNFNFMPLVLTSLGLLAFSMILFMLGVIKNKHGNYKEKVVYYE